MSNFSATKEWAARIEHCPTKSEDNKCVGQFTILAHLRVEVEYAVTTKQVFKVLPTRFREIFKVDWATFDSGPFSIFCSDDVYHCKTPPFESPAPNPRYIPGSVPPDYQVHYGLPAGRLKPSPPSQSDHDLSGRTSIVWQEGHVETSGHPDASVDVDLKVPLLRRVKVEGEVGLQLVSGDTYPLVLDWTISGRNCLLEVDSNTLAIKVDSHNWRSPSTSWNDAKRVFDALGEPPP